MFDFDSQNTMQLVAMHNAPCEGAHFRKPAPVRGKATCSTSFRWGFIGRMLMALGVLS